jgi:hypothetical protein
VTGTEAASCSTRGRAAAARAAFIR